MLINTQIFAMGAFDRADRESVDDGWRYYEKAKEALAAELFAKGTLQLVQGVAIMSNYLWVGWPTSEAQ